MAHIALCVYENMSDSVKKHADKKLEKTGSLGEIFQLLALNEDVYFATDTMVSKFLLKETLLPYVTKQRIAILVSLDNGCKMCAGVHKQLARALGVSEVEIEEIALGIDALSCSEAEKRLLHFCIRASKKNYKIMKEDIEVIKAFGYSEKDL
ncbi:carboxymuconolactone decarboxylase family protein [Sulfurospirillum diekertiae]|uniref:carboxymuconolactone decarboxylase family protein n=1 Tax=Sulfurospirillum diekertiae TaxID=1854492 RepID=UPI001E37C64D|nr:carboxymuconolactone decarboxylase family protein [Sulfurospirillum diekertiae]